MKGVYDIHGSYKKTGEEFRFSEAMPISLHNIVKFKELLASLEKEGDFWVNVKIKYYES